MAALEPTDYRCEIIWLGAVMDRPTVEVDTDARPTLDLTWDGVAGAAHTGRTRPSDSRVLKQHDRGTEIANVRQISMVSAEDLEHIRQGLGLDDIKPEWLGANIVVTGLPDFSHIPPSSRLQAANGTTLVVDMQNFPCHRIGMTINRDLPGQGTGFKDVAKGRRGITTWVERPGSLTIGDELILHTPSQRAWTPQS